MKKPRKMLIYNLFPLLAGRFNHWGPHLRRASEMGFTWIFINPIQYPGFSGSLYSIKDYFAFNPLFLDQESGKPPDEQVRDTVRQAEAMGLKVMVDLVVNHSAVDSNLVLEHPEWYAWEKKGKVANPYALDKGKKVVWGDLAKFDHRGTRDKEGLYRFFFRVVCFLADLGLKGFRCDAAYQVPGRFWRKLIRETKARYPDALFFAETLGCTADQTRKTASAGFDYIFNSSKWWGGNVAALMQRYLFAALFSSGLMMPMGYEFGFRRKLHVVKTRPGDWEETGIDITPFIRDVNAVKAAHPAFQEEAPTGFFQNENPSVLIMWKCSTTTREEALVIINKDTQGKQHFHANSLYGYIQSRAPLRDISPGNALDYIPEPFSYELMPGQCIVLLTEREKVPGG
jgi:starch synthase (maltosyl-transferring)